jgi:CO/xanthine dehydrogenase Mo-binding subunit
MNFARPAQRAIEMGGKFDGHEIPADINPFTKTSAAAHTDHGLMGVAKDNYPHDGNTYSFVIGFAEVEVDVETGKTTLVDYLAVGDVGTVVNPRSLGGQLLGGTCLGVGHALTQRVVFEREYGMPLAKRFHYNKPLTILDIPPTMEWMALDMPDPETPVGARGVGEPPVGSGYAAVMNAISDAIGEDAFRRAPVTPDLVLMYLEHNKRMHEPLKAHV